MNESALNTYHRGDQWIKACGFNEADIIRRLLDEGADVEQEASNPLYRGNFSPLLQACRHGRLDTARLLLDRGAAVDRVMYGGTPLMIACGARNNTASEHNIDVVRLLLDRGADVNHTVWRECSSAAGPRLTPRPTSACSGALPCSVDVSRRMVSPPCAVLSR